MPGGPDHAFVLARRALLDALDALGPHRPSVVLVGAQAVYVHTGPEDLAVAPYTTDVDLAVDRAKLRDAPAIDVLMTEAGFRPGDQPGIWINPDGVPVDLLVPEAHGGAGRRGARLGGTHGKRTARKVTGIEAVSLDAVVREVTSFDRDERRHAVAVAGPASLVVAKVHKVAERVAGGASRLDAKDALDVFRLLRLPSEAVGRTMAGFLDDEIAAAVTHQALGWLAQLFASPGGEGVELVARAVAGLEPADTIRRSCVALARELLAATEQAAG